MTFTPLLYMFFAALFFTPARVLAAPKTFAGLLQVFIDIMGYTLVLLYVVALLVFVYGIAQFIMNTSDEKKREEGKKWMLWAVIALFVGITLWGIVYLFTATFGTGGPFIPTLPTE